MYALYTKVNQWGIKSDDLDANLEPIVPKFESGHGPNVTGVVTIVSIVGSVLIYTASSFDRYLAVKNPFRSKSNQLLLCKISLAVIWMIAISTSLCPILHLDDSKYQFVIGLVITGTGGTIGIVYLVVIERI